MARRVQIVIDDDLDGGPADETVSFAIDGESYEIDLSAKNAEKFRRALRPYIENARAAEAKSRKTRSRPRPAGRKDLAAVREWARSNGIPVSQRGRISAEVISRYEAAHN